MKTNRLLAAAIAAAMTITAMPAYTVSRTENIISAYAEGESKYCGQAVKDGITYDCYSDHAEVLYSSDVKGEIVIPDILEAEIIRGIDFGKQVSLPVTMINEDAFMGNTSITKAVIPESVTRAGCFVFADCTSLTEVVIPEGLTDIGAGFIHNTPAGEEYMGDSDAMVINGTVLEVREGKVDIVIPDGAVRTAYSVNSYITDDVRSITFPEGFETIGIYGFKFTCVEKVCLPSTLKAIESYNFDTGITIEYAGSVNDWRKVEIDYFGNSGLSGEGAVIYGKADTPEMSGIFTISKMNSDIRIERCSADASGDIIIEAEDPADRYFHDITSIADGAFSGCSRITGITIPRSVYMIGKAPFEGCTSLTDIYYTGTERDWNKYLSDVEIPEGVELHFETKQETDLFVSVEAGGKIVDRGSWGDVYVGSEGKFINTSGFGCNETVTSLTFEEGLKEIDGELFCYELREIWLPKSLIYCDEEAFISCDFLTDIWYSGTIEDWNGISVHPCIPEGVSLHCRDEESGEYVTAGVVNVCFEDVSGSYNNEFRAYPGPDNTVLFDWYSGSGYVSVAVPLTGEETEYIIARDSYHNYKVYSELGEKVTLTKDKPFCTGKVVAGGEKPVLFEDIDKPGKLFMSDRGVVISVPGRNAVLSSVAGEAIFCKLLKQERDRSYYVVTASESGSYALTASSDDRAEDETRIFSADYIIIAHTECPTEPYVKPVEYVNMPVSEGIWGDANCDGAVNIADSVAVLQFITNQREYGMSEIGMINADIDGDPGITGYDAIAIMKIDAGILIIE